MITLIDTIAACSSDLDLKVRGQLRVNEEHLCHRCVFGEGATLWPSVFNFIQLLGIKHNRVDVLVRLHEHV